MSDSGVVMQARAKFKAEDLLRMFGSAEPEPRAPQPNGHAADSDIIPEGSRNATLIREGGKLRRTGLDFGPLRASLLAMNTERCRPKLPESEVENIARSLMRYPPAPVRERDYAPPPPDEIPPPTDEDLRGPWRSESEAAYEPRGPEVARLRLLTAEEFEADVAPDAIVETLIYRGSTHNLNGASKAGKSYNVYQLAMCIASGSDFLGLRTTRARVLVLSLELSAGSVRKRMRAIADSTGIPMPEIGTWFHIAAPTRGRALDLNLTTDDGWRQLEATIRETGAEVVVFDTLYRFTPGLDPSSNQDMGKVYGRFNMLAQQTDAALLNLDHTTKGEFAGPVSHSGIGAQVKGGAAAVVISLRRTSREDGGRWEVDVESWYGSWDEPLYYERPKLHTGERGAGCVVCSAAEAHGLPVERVQDLFKKYGEKNAEGLGFFKSKNALTQALIAEKVASGNADAAEMIAAIQRDYCVPSGAQRIAFDKPITTSDGPNRAVIFTWRGDLAEGDPE